MLRGLIQQEIELGIEVHEGNMWAFETYQMLDKYWEEFAWLWILLVWSLLGRVV